VKVRALIPVALVALVAARCGGGGGGGGGESSSGTTACKDVTAPKPRNAALGALQRPPLDTGKKWRLTFATSCGTFVVALDPAVSPRATASLVALARKKYFDDTVFHRIVPGFVIQGGDPTQSGSGGPGYTTVDTPDATTRYVKGTVAMAKAATEPRGAAGSQFFVMTADAPTLDPDYAVVGRVVSGMPVVEKIGELGDASDPNGTPTRTVVIDTVSVSSQ